MYSVITTYLTYHHIKQNKVQEISRKSVLCFEDMLKECPFVSCYCPCQCVIAHPGQVPSGVADHPVCTT